MGILMKEKMVEKIVRDNTDHIIAQLHSGDHSKCLTPDQIHLKLYYSFKQNIQNSFDHLFRSDEHLYGASPKKIVNILLQNLERIINFAQDELEKKETDRKNKKLTQLLNEPPKEIICQKCETSILFKKVEIEKNKILYRQFNDPYNFFRGGRSDIAKILEQDDNGDENDFEENRKNV